MDSKQHPIDFLPYNVLARVFRLLENQHLDELLFGRIICSERYIRARKVLVHEVSNLIRMVL